MTGVKDSRNDPEGPTYNYTGDKGMFIYFLIFPLISVCSNFINTKIKK